jgi:hypothetical protein
MRTKEGRRSVLKGKPPEGSRRAVLWWRSAGPLIVVLVVVALSLAACGGSPSNSGAGLASTTTTSTGSAAPTPLAAGLRYVNCMRSNGVTNFPDPSNSGRPDALKQIDPNSPGFLRAYTACRKEAPKGGIGPPAPTVAQLRFALAFAQCMHDHGYPQFPEPIATAPDPDQAEFTLGQGMYFPTRGSIGVGSPAFTHAAKVCGVEL